LAPVTIMENIALSTGAVNSLELRGSIVAIDSCNFLDVMPDFRSFQVYRVHQMAGKQTIWIDEQLSTQFGALKIL